MLHAARSPSQFRNLRETVGLLHLCSLARLHSLFGRRKLSVAVDRRTRTDLPLPTRSLALTSSWFESEWDSEVTQSGASGLLIVFLHLFWVRALSAALSGQYPVGYEQFYA